MQSKAYPKVYILLEPFDASTGMGVTMTNLFKDWPLEKIAIAAYSLDIDLCEKIRPCKNYLALSTPTIPISKTSNRSFANKYKFLRKFVKFFYEKLGISDMRNITLGESLKKSISDFQPDIIFTALGTLSRIKFVQEVNKFYPSSKLAIYIVDDWPNTKQNGRWFPWFWKNKYNKSLKALMDKSSYFFSICQIMSDSYLAQYGKRFIPFHNPVDNEVWENVKPIRHYPSNIFSIIYVGKINRDTKENILTLGKVIDSMNRQGIKIRFDVYTPSKHQIDTSQYIGFTINSPIPNDQIPSLLKGYDTLYLTLGFSKISRAYTRLSMPTKLTEYLASGVPILLHTPREIAVTKYVKQKNSAIICSENSALALEKTLRQLINDSKLRESLTKSALKLAKEHDIHIISNKFREALSL